MSHYKMKLSSILILLTMWALVSQAQDSISAKQPVNSCKEELHLSYPDLKYSYNDSSLTHDYSGNWDFDGDGKKDKLYLIGTGGAHLYFYLRIILSSDSLVRDFPFLEIDFPCLGTAKELYEFDIVRHSYPQLVVSDFDSKGISEIYINASDLHTLPKRWKRKGVNSKRILLKYEKGDIVLENFNLSKYLSRNSKVK